MKVARSSCGITLLRPVLLITGSFALKFFPSGFGILLTHSKPRLDQRTVGTLFGEERK